MRVVGNSLVRVDAFEKVTGFVQYAGDIKLPDMLYAKLLRSPFPHAEIVSIKTRSAQSGF